MIIANRLSEFIKNQGIKPDEFAVQVGADRSVIYRLMRDRTLMISANLQRRIKAAYPQVTMADLFEDMRDEAA